MKCDDSVLIGIAADVVNHGTILFLTTSLEEADQLASRFRHTFVIEASRILDLPTHEVEQRHFKKVYNTSFVSIIRGGWVLFHPASDMEADEAIGNPQKVYWPTQDGNHLKEMSYKEWQEERRKGIIWYTPPRPKTEPKDVWERLKNDEED